MAIAPPSGLSQIPVRHAPEPRPAPPLPPKVEPWKKALSGLGRIATFLWGGPQFQFGTWIRETVAGQPKSVGARIGIFGLGLLHNVVQLGTYFGGMIGGAMVGHPFMGATVGNLVGNTINNALSNWYQTVLDKVNEATGYHAWQVIEPTKHYEETVEALTVGDLATGHASTIGTWIGENLGKVAAGPHGERETLGKTVDFVSSFAIDVATDPMAVFGMSLGAKGTRALSSILGKAEAASDVAAPKVAQTVNANLAQHAEDLRQSYRASRTARLKQPEELQQLPPGPQPPGGPKGAAPELGPSDPEKADRSKDLAEGVATRGLHEFHDIAETEHLSTHTSRAATALRTVLRPEEVEVAGILGKVPASRPLSLYKDPDVTSRLITSTEHFKAIRSANPFGRNSETLRQAAETSGPLGAQELIERAPAMTVLWRYQTAEHLSAANWLVVDAYRTFVKDAQKVYDTVRQTSGLQDVDFVWSKIDESIARRMAEEIGQFFSQIRNRRLGHEQVQMLVSRLNRVARQEIEKARVAAVSDYEAFLDQYFRENILRAATEHPDVKENFFLDLAEPMRQDFIARGLQYFANRMASAGGTAPIRIGSETLRVIDKAIEDILSYVATSRQLDPRAVKALRDTLRQIYGKEQVFKELMKQRRIASAALKKAEKRFAAETRRAVDDLKRAEARIQKLAKEVRMAEDVKDNLEAAVAKAGKLTEEARLYAATNFIVSELGEAVDEITAKGLEVVTEPIRAHFDEAEYLLSIGMSQAEGKGRGSMPFGSSWRGARLGLLLLIESPRNSRTRSKSLHLSPRLCRRSWR